MTKILVASRDVDDGTILTGETSGIGTQPIVPDEFESIIFRGNYIRQGIIPGQKDKAAGQKLSDYAAFVLYAASNTKYDLSQAITDANLTVAYDQITQITFNFEDPGMTYFKAGVFDLGGQVTFRGLHYIINSNATTGGKSGLGGCAVTVRPKSVEDLKQRTEAFSLQNASPSDYVRVECQAVGAKYYVEDSPARDVIVRDQPQVTNGVYQQYAHDEKPSAWTTMERLAGEIGYVLFECYGTIYFVRPTWLSAKNYRTSNRHHNVSWNPASTSTVDSCVSFPELDFAYDGTFDNPGVSITFELVIEEAHKYVLGDVVQMAGIPGVKVPLFVSAISYSLAGNGTCSITAIQPIDPQPSLGTADGGMVDGGNNTTAAGAATIKPGTYAGLTLDSEMAANATIIYNTTAAYGGMTNRDAQIAIMTAITESTLHNYTVAVDHDSLGCFQQRASWGSVSQRTNVATSTRLFLDREKNVPNRNSRDLGDVCQTVQVSAYPGRYNLHAAQAAAIVAAAASSSKVIDQAASIAASSIASALAGFGFGKGSTGGKTKRASDFVNIALKQTGKRYVFGAQTDLNNTSPAAFDCSLLVQWALFQVGLTDFPRTSGAQSNWCVARGGGIYKEEALRTRGALLFVEPNVHVAISLGNGRTIEAANENVGVVSYSADRPEFNVFAKVPGLIYP